MEMQWTPLNYLLSLAQEQPGPARKVSKVFLHDNEWSRHREALLALLLLQIIEIVDLDVLV